MHETINMLIKGDERILTYYARATDRWKKLLEGLTPSDVDKLTTLLDRAQDGFEADCDQDRELGKEVMAVAGIAHLYDPGPGFTAANNAMAMTVLRALKRSNCSVEVHGSAQDTAEFYNLVERTP